MIHIVVEKIEGESGQMVYFILALRQAIGDFDTSTMIEGSEYKNIVWIVWFLLMMVGNIVFMNFLIAVVSESYEKCIQNMTSSI